VVRIAHIEQQQARSFADAEAELNRAWSNPRYTQVTLEPVDVNRVLREHYTLARALTFTRAMLWDVEARKARDPLHYIPTVVQQGHSWGFQRTGDEERLIRASQQRQWISGEVGLVLELAYLNHRQQRVIFLGVRELRDEDGTLLHSDARQPLFHVEHAVGGTETHPLNLWRAVHLTDGRDERLVERFAQIGSAPGLPEFIELYIRRDLQIGLTPHSAAKA
jgi:hypothetical protein